MMQTKQAYLQHASARIKKALKKRKVKFKITGNDTITLDGELDIDDLHEVANIMIEVSFAWRDEWDETIAEKAVTK